MAPEHQARPRAVYDHESDEQPRRRRRAAADWGVGEDIFDRMPSRRFKRADRRAEHREIVLDRPHEERDAAAPRDADERVATRQGQDAAAPRRAAVRQDEPAPRRAAAP